MKPRPLLLLAIIMALAAWMGAGQPNTNSNISTLDTSCETQLEAIWERYTNASEAPVDGCDASCLGACRQTLLDALWAVNVQDCPPQADIQRCFHYFGDAWTEYAAQCALFQYGSASSGATTSSAEGEAGRRRLTQAQGEAAAASSSSANATDGCFPPFADVGDFESYVNGEWSFETKSNSVGIALTVLFFCGLAAVGVLMKG